jgi:hypothetical protein
MIKNFLDSDSKIPNLAFHSKNLTEDAIVIYGGLKIYNEISGDLHFLYKDKLKFNTASWANNKNSNTYLYSFSNSKILS